VPGHAWSCLNGEVHIQRHPTRSWPSLGRGGVGQTPCIAGDCWNRPLVTNKLCLCPPSCFTELPKKHSQSTHGEFKKRERRNPASGCNRTTAGLLFWSELFEPSDSPTPLLQLPRTQRFPLAERSSPARRTSSNTIAFTVVVENPCSPGSPCCGSFPSLSIASLLRDACPHSEALPAAAGSVSSHGKSAFNCAGTRA